MRLSDYVELQVAESLHELEKHLHPGQESVELKAADPVPHLDYVLQDVCFRVNTHVRIGLCCNDIQRHLRGGATLSMMIRAFTQEIEHMLSKRGRGNEVDIYHF